MNKVAIITACAALLPLGLMLSGCKEDEPPPPLPTAAPEPVAEAEAVTLLEEPEVDAGVDAAKKSGGARRAPAGLAACCAALSQNAANAPEPTATYMKTAAQTCSTLVGQGQAQGVVSAAVQQALRGANMPSACQ